MNYTHLNIKCFEDGGFLLKKPIGCGGVQIQHTISCGLAKAKDGICYNNLINQADEALYKDKVDVTEFVTSAIKIQP